MNDVIYRRPELSEINLELFSAFERHQKVEKCLRKIDGEWKAVSVPFVEEWTEQEYLKLVEDLKNTVRTGGYFLAGFYKGKLKAFVSVESTPMGAKKNYLELSCIHVSEDMRGHGIGLMLFTQAADWAKRMGAEKLYISSHSAVESQSFYAAMGCTDTEEISKPHAEKEPCDRQLEYKLI